MGGAVTRLVAREVPAQDRHFVPSLSRLDGRVCRG